jgi:hypothetical protein
MTSATHQATRRAPRSVDDVLGHRAGVISRAQILACGEEVWDIRRRLRHREWVRLLPGVSVDHTGAPTWTQRAWAGVLYLAPAALAGQAAIRTCVGPGWRGIDESAPIEIAVAPERNVQVPRGYLRRRPAHFHAGVRWNATPPRINLEDAALDVAVAATDEFATIAALADVCQTRRTTASRILVALSARQRVRRRAWLATVLDDIAQGTCSVLEHGYLTRVERAHGLPVGDRQSRSWLGVPGRLIPRVGPRGRARRSPLSRHRAEARPRPRPRAAGTAHLGAVAAVARCPTWTSRRVAADQWAVRRHR